MIDPERIRKRVRVGLAEQRSLVASLLRLRAQLQGSLFVRYGQCGKAGCGCRQGSKHGPYYVLSTRSGGKGGFAYLDGQKLEQARMLVERYREFRRGMRRLKKLNLELVTLLRRYQKTSSREGGRRIGIAATV
jgi:hypothetical protein